MKEQTDAPKVSSDHNEAKRFYQTPILKEHGSAQDITLQTFFGTFSPPAN